MSLLWEELQTGRGWAELWALGIYRNRDTKSWRYLQTHGGETSLFPSSYTPTKRLRAGSRPLPLPGDSLFPVRKVLALGTNSLSGLLALRTYNFWLSQTSFVKTCKGEGEEEERDPSKSCSFLVKLGAGNCSFV